MLYEDSVMRTLLRSTERTLRPPMAVSVPCMEPNGDESNAYEMVVTEKHLVSLTFSGVLAPQECTTPLCKHIRLISIAHQQEIHASEQNWQRIYRDVPVRLGC